MRTVGLALVLVGCAHSRVPQLPADFEPHAPAESLRTSLQRVVDSGWNPARLDAAEARARDLGLNPTTEWIDWFSFQHNVLIEVPGRTDELVYITAHADKTDANLLKVLSLLFNGLLDEAIAWSYFSEGALDNATGVAIALELARALRAAGPLERTYRVLITGSEESGLRGARAHVARLSDAEWARLRFAVNVDSVGSAADSSCVMADQSDRSLTERVLAIARGQSFDLKRGTMPFGAGGDHAAFDRTSFPRDLGRGLMFNLVPGGLLPQRSWFTGSHGTRVVVFADCDLLDAGDLLSGFPFAWGRLHSFRDTADKIDPVRLYRVYATVLELLLQLDSGPKPLSPPADAAPAPDPRAPESAAPAR